MQIYYYSQKRFIISKKKVYRYALEKQNRNQNKRNEGTVIEKNHVYYYGNIDKS